MFVLRFSMWKRRDAERFMPGCVLRYIDDPQDAPSGSTILAWAAHANPDLKHHTERLKVVQVEDGFLRSVGLGAALVRPCSWVFDRSGIHFDSSRTSDLERLLQEHEFQPQDLERARALRDSILRGRLTKYNVGSVAPPSDPSPARKGREVILVAGQVEGDASLRLGSPVVKTNLALLKAVRARRPAAHIVYKPHPDVTSKLRSSGADEGLAGEVADEVLTAVNLHQALSDVDAVHVMTSLAGFEALLRNVPVVTHGQPFYAGWGLTEDLHPVPRRTRRRTLDELIAATLIVYPRYDIPGHGGLRTAEEVVEHLSQSAQREVALNATIHGRFLRGAEGLLANWIVQFFRATDGRR